jgi:hypothetical protein
MVVDRLLLFMDARQPANLVALWRDEIPADWRGLPGQDRRVAGVLALPEVSACRTNEEWSVENSVCVSGAEAAVARYNGMVYGLANPAKEAHLAGWIADRISGPATPVPGVVKVRWNARSRQLERCWVNNRINCNNVLTLSRASHLLYGSGCENGVFHFYGLDWTTGAVKIRLPLGSGADYIDGGNGYALLEDRSVVFGVAAGMIRIRPTRK